AIQLDCFVAKLLAMTAQKPRDAGMRADLDSYAPELNRLPPATLPLVSRLALGEPQRSRFRCSAWRARRACSRPNPAAPPRPRRRPMPGQFQDVLRSPRGAADCRPSSRTDLDSRRPRARPARPQDLPSRPPATGGDLPAAACAPAKRSP